MVTSTCRLSGPRWLIFVLFLQVVPAIDCLTKTGALFEDGRSEDFDAVILSTGYRSNVPRWLKVAIYFLFSDP